MTCQPCTVPECYIKNPVKITPLKIIDAVCSVYDVTITRLRGRSRKTELVDARHMAMYVMRNHTHLTLKDIGTILGDRDHTTVIHGCFHIRTERGYRRGVDMQQYHKEKYRQVMEMLK